MATCNFYLDLRRYTPGKPAPLKIAITSNSDRAFIPTPFRLLPEEWDAKMQQVVSASPQSKINLILRRRKLDIDTVIFDLEESGALIGRRPCEIRDIILETLNPTPKKRKGVADSYDEFMTIKTGRTAEIYKQTRARLVAFLGDKGWTSLSYEDVNRGWLDRFDAFLRKTSPSANARSIHLRNLRAVFNYAIDNEDTACYPFRRYKIRHEATRKRALSIEQIRQIMSAHLPAGQRLYRDLWALTFMLVGINFIDLCNLKSIDDGRVEYKRAKTHRLYSLKVEPEAGEIIDRYAGESRLLYFLERYKSYRTFYYMTCRGLRAVLKTLNDSGGNIPGLTTYWARHSWATVAASLDIPKETIAAALGHGGNTVTDIYIDFDTRKIDEANRRVLDWVLYGTK